MRIEQYYLYDAEGRFHSGVDDMASAVERAKAMAKIDGRCDVEQIIVSPQDSQVRRTRFYSDGRMERLWKQKENPMPLSAATQGMES